MAPEWLIAPQSPITCRFAMKNAFKRGIALSCSVLRFWVISEKPHFLAKNDTFWLIYLVTLFAPQSPFNHNLPMQNAFKWGIARPCSVLRFPISSLDKGHVHCALYKVTQHKITFFGGSQKSFFTPLGDMGNHLAFTWRMQTKVSLDFPTCGQGDWYNIITF